MTRLGARDDPDMAEEILFDQAVVKAYSVSKYVKAAPRTVSGQLRPFCRFRAYGRPDMEEDLHQDCFEKLLDVKEKKLSEIRSWNGYLAGIVYHRAVDLHRGDGNGRWQWLPIDDQLEQPGLAADMIDWVSLDVRTALAALQKAHEDQWRVFILRTLHENPLVAIDVAEGKKPKTEWARGRYQRAIRFLRNYLAEPAVSKGEPR